VGHDVRRIARPGTTNGRGSCRDPEQCIEESLVTGQELTAPVERDGAHQMLAGTGVGGTGR
jgi:hypothetical protein